MYAETARRYFLQFGWTLHPCPEAHPRFRYSNWVLRDSAAPTSDGIAFFSLGELWRWWRLSCQYTARNVVFRRKIVEFYFESKPALRQVMQRGFELQTLIAIEWYQDYYRLQRAAAAETAPLRPGWLREMCRLNEEDRNIFQSGDLVKSIGQAVVDHERHFLELGIPEQSRQTKLQPRL